jgi:hypothetical protein
MSLEWSLVLIIEEIGTYKQDAILDNEIMIKNQEHEALLKEVELLRTLVNQGK